MSGINELFEKGERDSREVRKRANKARQDLMVRVSIYPRDFPSKSIFKIDGARLDKGIDMTNHFIEEKIENYDNRTITPKKRKK
jgi:hypothetical protein